MKNSEKKEDLANESTSLMINEIVHRQYLYTKEYIY